MSRVLSDLRVPRAIPGLPALLVLLALLGLRVRRVLLVRVPVTRFRLLRQRFWVV